MPSQHKEYVLACLEHQFGTGHNTTSQIDRALIHEAQQEALDNGGYKARIGQTAHARRSKKRISTLYAEAVKLPRQHAMTVSEFVTAFSRPLFDAQTQKGVFTPGMPAEAIAATLVQIQTAFIALAESPPLTPIGYYKDAKELAEDFKNCPADEIAQRANAYVNGLLELLPKELGISSSTVAQPPAFNLTVSAGRPHTRYDVKRATALGSLLGSLMGQQSLGTVRSKKLLIKRADIPTPAIGLFERLQTLSLDATRAL